jgi:hypothetical protein
MRTAACGKIRSLRAVVKHWRSPKIYAEKPDRRGLVLDAVPETQKREQS